MQRWVSLALLVALSACADSGPEPTPTPRTLTEASCDEQRGGTEEALPDFVKVELESRRGVDAVTFRFRQSAPDAPDVPPAYIVQFVDQLVTDGEGAPVEVEGEAFLAVSFQAIGVDLVGEEPIDVYTGPKEFSPRFPVVRQLKQTGDFEGVVSWGIGLARRECVQITADGSRMTLEFASA
ncbi:MAG TPA: hypothetical protein VE575_03925 [Acidimicrobiales bacterium]|nr:hypothetical protein [Acidimicrobiales bacterium]